MKVLFLFFRWTQSFTLIRNRNYDIQLNTTLTKISTKRNSCWASKYFLIWNDKRNSEICSRIELWEYNTIFYFISNLYSFKLIPTPLSKYYSKKDKFYLYCSPEALHFLMLWHFCVIQYSIVYLAVVHYVTKICFMVK